MKDFGTVLGDTQAIRINRLESRLSPLVPFPHRHAFYHLVLTTSGSGWHEIDFHRYPVAPHQVYWMNPGQVHSWQLSDTSRGYVIEFEDKSILQNLQNTKNHIDLSQFSSESRKRFLQLLDLMMEEYETQRPQSEIYLKHLLILLILDLSRLGFLSSQRPKNLDPILDRFQALIEIHFKKAHRVSFYAKQLKTTEKALTMRVSRALGKSARTVIQERCLLESKRLLAYSNLSIAQIAFELGFEDPNYFSRFFREKCRQTPVSFRHKTRTDIIQNPS